MREMITAAGEPDAPEAALEQAPADAAGRLRGHLRGDGGPAGDDPPARSARCTSSSRRSRRRPTTACERGSARSTRRTRRSAPVGAASGCSGRRSTRCRCGRSCERPGGPRPHRAGAAGRDHAPARRLRRGARAAARADVAHCRRGGRVDVPLRHDDRAAGARASVADEIAEHADFFSFGTNDLTQTRSASRATTPKGSSSPATSRTACSSGTPSRRSTRAVWAT